MSRERDRALVRYGMTSELTDVECDRVIDLVDRSLEVRVHHTPCAECGLVSTSRHTSRCTKHG
jgi:hypothetical protein